MFASDAWLTGSERLLAKEVGAWIGKVVRDEEVPTIESSWGVAEDKIVEMPAEEVFGEERMDKIRFWIRVAEGAAAMQCAASE